MYQAEVGSNIAQKCENFTKVKFIQILLKIMKSTERPYMTYYNIILCVS